MTRIGPWVFAAGLALLGAGILSTRSVSWKKHTRIERTVALDMRGVETLDIGDSPINKIGIANRPARLRIDAWNDVDGDAETVSWTRDGTRIRFHRKSRRVTERMNVDFPPGVKSLSGRELDIQADANAGALHIETFKLSWKGNAEALDIHIRAWPAYGCEDLHDNKTPRVSFSEGNVGLPRISIERGVVDLDDLSQVERIEIHAGPGVGLHVARLGDLKRLELHPFDGTATPLPQASDDDAAKAACNAINARI